jgi:molecular chaperone GrpE
MPEENTPPDGPEIPVEVDAQPTEQVTTDDRIASAEKEKKEVYDRLVRTTADFDNFRKRSRKDVDDARLKAREETLKDILPVIDNLERALAAGNDATTAAAVVEGVKLVLRQAQSALEKLEVKGFNSVGEAFDPARHEAISQVETAEFPPGTVAAEMQKGYTLGPRLLRPALVAVAKAPAPPPAETPPTEAAGA